MPVIVTFDVPVKNRREFEKNMHVTSSPAQQGSWHWYHSREVRFRPKNYWKPGTKVTVAANINGLNAGGGIYGQMSKKTHFTVGRSMITKINLSTDVAKVYRNGKFVRRIYVSGGKPGWQTRSGVKLIMDKLYTTRMTNQMIGAREEYEPQREVRDADHLLRRVPPCCAVERRSLWPTERQSRLRRDEHGERRLVVQPHPDR